MCLSSPTTKEPLIAKEDITCYKVFVVRNGRLLSSIRGFKYELNKLYKSDLKMYFFGEINIGLHSFAYKRGANGYANPWNEVVFKAVIPKGAKYFKGKFTTGSNTYVSYASNQIKIIEKL